ncbi:uncharacterized protein At4g18490 [Abrus precatorius]|uniref:Uncharacterized protein At4g18490 n=1 Tax=Abrus precatorius TaxID=3816 RepID=A0A8B8KWP7_ABRPR|nr:uncharacterized protein At4g18490 [Abrus precatorius]
MNANFLELNVVYHVIIFKETDVLSPKTIALPLPTLTINILTVVPNEAKVQNVLIENENLIQNVATPHVDNMYNPPIIYDEIGKGLLSSWKSMSMADDDAMDFSFDTVSKSKKKTFDFEKLDINFNLDGEFDKISSFKLDMSDLDFTCLPKKTSQSKDKKAEASGAKAGKQDGFNFSFDFNELDSFNLDSSLIKVDTSSSSNPRKKGVTTDGSDNEAAKMPKTNDDGVHTTNGSLALKPPASEMLETMKVETLDGSLGNIVSKEDGSVSKILSAGNLDLLIENQTFDTSRCKSAEEVDQERDIPEKTKSSELKSEQVISMAPSQSVGKSDSEQDTILNQRTKVFSSGTSVINVSGDTEEVNNQAVYEHTKMFSSGRTLINVSGDKHEVNDKSTYVDSDGVDLPLEHTSPPHISKSDSSVEEAINLGSSTQERVTNDPHPEKRYTGCENINKADALKNVSCDNDTGENRKTTSECHLAPSSSKHLVDKMMPMKDKKLQDMQSNMFSMPEDKRENFRSNDTMLGSKLVSNSIECSSKLIRDAATLLDSKDDPKTRSNTREEIASDVMPSTGKLAGNMQSFREEVNKSKATFLENSMSTKDLTMLSSQVNPSCLTEKTGRTTNQISVNSQPEASGKESSEKSRIASIEGNKLSSFKSCKITPTLSSLKTLRNIGANRVQATSLHKNEKNSLLSLGQRMEIQGITAPTNHHLTDSGDNQKSSTPFLKRKTIEVSEADCTSLRSLKRLCQSPSKSRNSKESSEEVVGEVESIPNNLLYSHSTSGLKSPSEIKVTEMEMPDSAALMEDNSNVEKAEAYMKELEDICNMLKKKHEEAKELLVQAIVNDNNLLMLNHPIYEEEISSHSSFMSFPPIHLMVDINAGYFLDICEHSEGSEICFAVDV